MKKLLAILICAAMVLSLATASFAAGLWDDVGGEEKPEGWEPAVGEDKDDNKDDTSDTPAGGGSSEVAPGTGDNKDDTSDSTVGGKDDTSDSVVGGGDNKDDTSDSVVGGGDNKDDTSDSVVGGGDNKDDTSDSVVGGGDNKDDTSDTPAGGNTGDNKDDTSDTPADPLPTKYIKINGAEFVAEGGKWAYNDEAVTKATATNYQMIIFDKGFTGKVETNGYGAAIVLNKYGELVKIYDGANGGCGFWTKDGKAAGPYTFDNNTYAAVAFNELEEGETLIIFPNGGDQKHRAFALDLRGLKGTNYFGEIADLEGFTWKVRQPVDPNPGETPVDPNPGETPDSGDSIVVFFALMALSMTAVVVLVSKKRAF